MAATDTDMLNALLRGEISATETYTQALERFSGQRGEAELRRMRDDHREAANALRQHVHRYGGEPSTGSGWWGTWAKLVEGTAKVFGNAAALRALKAGEEHGISEYQEALDGYELPEECMTLIRADLLPRCQAHLPVIDRLIAQQAAS